MATAEGSWSSPRQRRRAAGICRVTKPWWKVGTCRANRRRHRIATHEDGKGMRSRRCHARRVAQQLVRRRAKRLAGWGRRQRSRSRSRWRRRGRRGRRLRPLTCGTFEPCGRSPIGSWSVAEKCDGGWDTIDVSSHPACRRQPCVYNSRLSGTITFTSSQEIRDLRIVGTQVFTLTPACETVLREENGGDCDDLGGDSCSRQRRIDDCVCTCGFDGSGRTTQQYDVQGNTLRYRDSMSIVPFCRAGGSLGIDWDAYVMLLRPDQSTPVAWRRAAGGRARSSRPAVLRLGARR